MQWHGTVSSSGAWYSIESGMSCIRNAAESKDTGKQEYAMREIGYISIDMSNDRDDN
jgi:hypothetical protein